MVDYGRSMEGPKIEKTIKRWKSLIDSAFMEDDKISYIVFNKDAMVVFDMAQKLRNTTFSKTAI